MNYSSWTNPDGIVRQLQEGLSRDRVTVFYMVDESEEGDQDFDFQVYQEVFRKHPTKG